MDAITLVLSVVIIVLRFFLALACYFTLRWLLARAVDWHVKAGGYSEAADGSKIWKRKAIGYPAQTALCLLAAAAVMLA